MDEHNIQYKLSAFTDISADELMSLKACFRAKTQAFSAHDCILVHAQDTACVGILMSGTAELCATDPDGRNIVIEQLSEGDIFGSMFTPAAAGMAYSTIATSRGEAMLLDYDHLMMRCPKACSYHSKLVSNVLQLTARKTQVMAEHISILTRHSIRERFMAYLAIKSAEAGQKDIRLPVTLTALADYLGVDRSAMMREMRHMADEGLITFKGKNISILY